MNSSLNPKVRLRSVQEQDSDLLYKWINNPNLVIFNSPFKYVSLEEHCQWFFGIQKNKNVVFFMIDHLESKSTIGSCQLMNINNIYRSAELQIRIGVSEFHARGIGTEAIRQLVDYGFNKLNLHRIGLHVFSTNTRAIRAYEKNGFIKEGLLKEAAFINGAWVDILMMGLLNQHETL